MIHQNTILLLLSFALFSCGSEMQRNDSVSPNLKSQSTSEGEQESIDGYPVIEEWAYDPILIQEYLAIAKLNGQEWKADHGTGWVRHSDKSGKLELSCKAINFGPRISFEFRTFDGVGDYSFGWEKKEFNLDCMLNGGARLKVTPEKSSFTVTEFNEHDSTISGTFSLYFDSKDNPHSAGGNICFQEGSYTKVPISIYAGGGD